MKLKNASSWFSFLIVLGAAWSFASSDFASAQTNQENYVVRDPVATGARYEQRPSSKSGHQSQYGQQPATRKFQPPRWASTVIPVQEQE